MKFILTEEEHQDLIPIRQHEIEINQLTKEIVALKNSLSFIQLKLKLKNKQERNNLSPQELNTLQSYLTHKSLEIIASTIKNCNIKIRASDRIPIKYYADWSGLALAELIGIKNNGEILVIEDNEEIEFLSLDTESIIQTATFVRKHIALK